MPRKKTKRKANFEVFTCRIAELGPPGFKLGYETIQANNFELVFLSVLDKFAEIFKAAFNGDEVKTRAYLTICALKTFAEDSIPTILEWMNKITPEDFSKILKNNLAEKVPNAINIT